MQIRKAHMNHWKDDGASNLTIVWMWKNRRKTEMAFYMLHYLQLELVLFYPTTGTTL